MAEIIASLSEADKKFFFNQVLTDINLTVKSGEILGLIGPEESGKTTCLRCLIGMEDLTAGKAHVLNEQMPKREMLSNIGYMGQEAAIYKTMTAYENMVFFGKLKNLKGEKLKSHIDKNLKLVELHEAKREVVSKFSVDMKRRLSLAIALLGSPKLIVLDEPEAWINRELQLKVWNHLRTLADEGAGIIVAVQKTGGVEKYDKVALLNNGRIMAEGSPEALMTEYKAASVEEVFINMEAVT